MRNGRRRRRKLLPGEIFVSEHEVHEEVKRAKGTKAYHSLHIRLGIVYSQEWDEVEVGGQFLQQQNSLLEESVPNFVARVLSNAVSKATQYSVLGEAEKSEGQPGSSEPTTRNWLKHNSSTSSSSKDATTTPQPGAASST